MDLQGQTVLIIHRTGFGAGTSGSAPRLRQLDRLLKVAGASAILLRWHRGKHELLSLSATSSERIPARASDDRASRPASRIPAPVRERLAITLAWKWTTRWHPFVRRHKEASQLIDQMQPRPSLVWAVSTGGVENLLLAERLGLLQDVRKVVSFHDPPRILSFSRFPKAMVRRAIKWSGRVDGVVTTNFDYHRLLEDALRAPHGHLRPRPPMVFLPLVSETERTALACGPDHPTRMDALKLAYAGRLEHRRGGRTLDPLVAALLELAAEFPSVSFRLDTCGQGSGHHRLVRRSRNTPPNLSIRYHGWLPVDKAASLTSSADISLVTQGIRQRFQTPNKVVELIDAKAQIVGLVPRSSELDQILSATPRAKAFDPTGTHITQQLVSFFRLNLLGDDAFNDSTAVVKQLSNSDLSSRLEDFVHNVHQT